LVSNGGPYGLFRLAAPLGCALRWRSTGLVGALEGVAPGRGGPQALLVAPTREIALQTAGVCRAIGGHLRLVRVGAFIGGTRMRHDAAIAATCEVACGTPGRLVGLLMAEAMIGERVRILVLDEADK